MPDVIMKIFASRPQHNGYSVASIQKSAISTASGMILAPRHNYPIEVSGIATRMDSRWDNPTYYTA